MELFFENKGYGITESGLYENSEILEASKASSKKAESFKDVIEIISSNKKKAERLLQELENKVKESGNNPDSDYLLDADSNNIGSVDNMKDFETIITPIYVNK